MDIYHFIILFLTETSWTVLHCLGCYLCAWLVLLHTIFNQWLCPVREACVRAIKFCNNCKIKNFAKACRNLIIGSLSICSLLSALSNTLGSKIICIHKYVVRFDFVLRIGIFLPKLFWPTVRKNCSTDWEKILKFEAEGWEFAKILRSLEQFVWTVKV